ncbi:hypothetical protein ABZ883_04455 [Streptomyces sp. NPDC046977]|uniref:hypothetical protein n=1 Tax=Streptomyces sp. NPDC046977 TaxID=3154703 RepID=UPI0033FCB7A9
MIALGRAVYDLAFGVAMLLVACDVRHLARRIHRRMPTRVVRPVLLRVMAAGAGTAGVVVGGVRLVSALGG